jgi:hypothetical protein
VDAGEADRCLGVHVAVGLQPDDRVAVEIGEVDLAIDRVAIRNAG